MFEGPRSLFAKDLESKQQEVLELTAQAAQKQKDVIDIGTELERYKIQIEGLNNRISDLEMENSNLKDKTNMDKQEDERKRLVQSLDMQKNVTKCQQMTIEKLGNRILILETEQREEAKADQGHTLEKAQLNRKVAALENQLRFQTNLNDETKKEIEKLDGEISQVADNCNSRESILQRKLEDVLEQLRRERVQNAALKSDMMQRENHIEQLKTSLKQ